MIYELRAYIGKAGQLYTAIFTSMEAAQKKAAKLRKVCAVDNVQLFGMQANQHEKDFKVYRVCDWVKSIELYTRKNSGEYAKIAGLYK